MFNLDSDKIKQAELGMNHSESSLPFPAPIFYVVNGKPESQGSVPTTKFGGWATDAEKLDQILAGAKVPSFLTVANFNSNSGPAFRVYTSRALVVSIACWRSSWISKDKRRTPEYAEGSRRHIQALGVVAVPGDNGFEIWSNVILSAKGLQAKKLLIAIEDWSRHTAVIRAKLAPGIPAFMFYCAMGTFGPEPVIEMVGSGTQKSPITPIVVLQKDIDKAGLEKIYGGETLLDRINELQKSSNQWVNAWGVPSNTTFDNAEEPSNDFQY